MTHVAGGVDDKDLAVSSNQGDTWLHVHTTLGIMGEAILTWTMMYLDKAIKNEFISYIMEYISNYS